MEIEKIRGYLAELDNLQVYQKRIRKVIETGLQTDLLALLQFNFIKSGSPTPEPIRKIYDSTNREVDLKEFPEFMQKQPWLMIPGATVKEIPQVADQELRFDIEVRSELLLFFLNYLLNKVEKRISIVQTALTNEKSF